MQTDPRASQPDKSERTCHLSIRSSIWLPWILGNDLIEQRVHQEGEVKLTSLVTLDQEVNDERGSVAHRLVFQAFNELLEQLGRLEFIGRILDLDQICQSIERLFTSHAKSGNTTIKSNQTKENATKNEQ